MPSPILVVGLGHVGFRAVELLRRLGEEVVAVVLPEGSPHEADAERLGARVVPGDARDERFLLESGLRDAKGVLLLTDRDVVNIEIALDARRHRPDVPIVIRLFDQNLARQLESGFDVRRALAVSALAAPAFAAAALGSDALGTFDAGGRLFVVRDRAAGEELAGRSLADAEGVLGSRILARGGSGPLAAAERIVVAAAGEAATPKRGEPPRRKHRIGGAARFVAALFRDSSRPLRTVFAVLLAVMAASAVVFAVGMELSPVDAVYFLVTTVTTTGYGDITPMKSGAALKLYAVFVMLLGSAAMATLFSIVTDFVVGERFRTVLGRPGADLGGHVVVVGLGNVGYRTAAELARAGVAVVGVDRSAEAELSGSPARGTANVPGDGRMRATLVDAGIERAAAVVAVTGDDATNLGVVLLARELNPAIRTVVRLFDADFARKVEGALSVDRALGASRVAAPVFVSSVLEAGVRSAFLTERELLVVVARSEAAWAGRSVADLAAAGVVLLGRFSADERLAPLSPGETLGAADVALAVIRKPLA